MTVLEYLAGRYRHSSPEVWREHLMNGEVRIDGKTAGPAHVLQTGNRLVWNRPPWNEPDVPLDYAVLARCDGILAVAKPRGLPTMPAGGTFFKHTLLNLVRRNEPTATPVHRLGRGTSGVVLFAYTKEAGAACGEALRRRNALKVYRALATGSPERDEFVVDTPIGPIPHPMLGTVHAASPEGKPALSRVRVLESRGDRSLLEVSIETGKPHQIRIHLAVAGHPLVGDPLFAAGGGILETGAALPGDIGYHLHAQRIRLIRPDTGALFDVSCTPPPILRTREERGYRQA